MSQNIQKSKSYTLLSEDSKPVKLVNLKKTFNKFKQIINLSNSPVYFYAAILFISYIFYQFGYSFMYGFYFGGNSTYIHGMDVMINQIPFDFKFLAISGLIVTTFCFLYFSPFYIYCSQNNENKRLFYFLLNLFSCLFIIFACIALHDFNLNNSDITQIFKHLVTASSVIWVIILIFDLFYSLSQSKLPTLIKKIFIIVFAMFALYVFYIVLLSLVPNTMTIPNYIYESFFSLGFGFLAILLDSKLFPTSFRANDPHPNQSIDLNTNKRSNNQKSKIAFQLFLIPLIIIGCVIFYIMAYIFFCNIGNSIGKNSNFNSMNTITYYNINKDNPSKSITGIVVAQEENTYYISSKTRELIVISSPYVTITPLNQTIPDELEDGDIKN